MQRLCPCYISMNWKFPKFSSFIKYIFKIFLNNAKINHQNDSETCRKTTKNCKIKAFTVSDATSFRWNFYVTAYVSQKCICSRKKYQKKLVTLRLIFTQSHVTQLFDKIHPFRSTHFPCGVPLLGGPNYDTKQCVQYIFIISHDHTSVYFANILQLLSLV